MKQRNKETWAQRDGKPRWRRPRDKSTTKGHPVSLSLILSLILFVVPFGRHKLAVCFLSVSPSAPPVVTMRMSRVRHGSSVYLNEFQRAVIAALIDECYHLVYLLLQMTFL